MASVSMMEALRQQASRLYDREDAVFGDFTSLLCGAAKDLLEASAVSEVERRLGFRLRERQTAEHPRPDFRNGYRTRTVQMLMSEVEIRIPRLRGSGHVPWFLRERHKALADVEEFVLRAFLAGVSESDTIRTMEGLCGFGPSKSVLSRVRSELDERGRQFRERRLEGRYQYLFLDAAWAKDIVGPRAVTVCLLTACAVTYDGRKEILGFERSPRENASSWRGFLRRLVDRGLNPRDLLLVISDEHKGLAEAVREVLGDVPHQLCWSHRMRNVRKSVPKYDRGALVADLRAVYDAPHRSGAVDAYRSFRANWHEAYPGVIRSVEEDLAGLLEFYSVPAEHRVYVRTSNPIERIFLELRRKSFGTGAFNNRAACDRACANVFARLNALWEERDVWQECHVRYLRAQRRQRLEAGAGHDAWKATA